MAKSPFVRAEGFKGSPLTEAEAALLRDMLARIGCGNVIDVGTVISAAREKGYKDLNR